VGRQNWPNRKNPIWTGLKFSRPSGTGFHYFLGWSLIPYGPSTAAVREIDLDKV
jgi:hypothetical protein